VAAERTQVILPRKAVVELARILGREPGEDAVLRIGGQSMRAEVGGVGMTAKLVDGKFPEYEAVIPAPERCNRHVRVDGETLRQSLSRAAILSNEKYRAVRLMLEADRMQILAHNQEHEEAEEEVPVELDGEPLEIGFNVTYLLDVLGVLGPGGVRMDLGDSNASCLLRGAEDDGSRFVIMPMRL
jgi:DNA polymerase-3 subunit beta